MNTTSVRLGDMSTPISSLLCFFVVFSFSDVDRRTLLYYIGAQ